MINRVRMERQLRGKLNKIFSSCKGVETVFIRNTSEKDPNFTYLTNFRGGLFEGDILIANARGLTLYASSLEYETAISQKFEGIRVIKSTDREVTIALLKSSLKGKTVGINGSFLPYAQYMLLKSKFKPKRIVDISKSFLDVRMIKNSEEIRNIEKASGITKEAMKSIHNELKEGVTEKDIARKFDNISELLGSEGTAFETIVCFGKNTALPHHKPDSTKLKVGDLVLIDAGSRIGNYCSDVTRTVIFGNKNEIKNHEKKVEMLHIVKEAQRKAMNIIKPGIKGSKVDKMARSYIDTAADGKYKDRFIHSLGHSIGVEAHDGEGFSPNSNEALRENMVITVEPGIYIPGFGGVRIEDDILITKTKCKIL